MRKREAGCGLTGRVSKKLLTWTYIAFWSISGGRGDQQKGLAPPDGKKVGRRAVSAMA